jgi:hypothetical protein
VRGVAVFGSAGGGVQEVEQGGTRAVQLHALDRRCSELGMLGACVCVGLGFGGAAVFCSKQQRCHWTRQTLGAAGKSGGASLYKPLSFADPKSVYSTVELDAHHGPTLAHLQQLNGAQ